MQPKLAAIVFALTGCMDHGADLEPIALELEPAMVSVTVVDGVPVVQPFVATLVGGDGSRRDVTAETRFALVDETLGSWRGSALELDGRDLGTTEIRATFGDATATASLLVRARNDYFGADIAAKVAAQIAAAEVAPACAPQIMYPAAGVIVPANLGELEVHWGDTHDDLFELAVSTQYLDVRVYSREHVAQLPGAELARIAQQDGAIALRVSGVVESSPTVKCVSEARRIEITRQPLAGTLHYWSPILGMQWQDMQQPEGGPQPMIPSSGSAKVQGDLAALCGGCAVSRDGTRIALPSKVIDVQHGVTNAIELAWDSVTFAKDGTRLIAAHGGELSLITETGAHLATLPTARASSHPQLSPDGGWLVNVEASNIIESGSALVVRRFAEATGTVGATREILAGAPGVANYHPAWSPDRQWLVFTRATGWGTDTTTASLWVMKSDGTQAPIQLTQPTTQLGLTARWAPTSHTVASSGERFFYVTYSSTQALGFADTGTHQLWMQPFFTDAGVTAPAIHLPSQWRSLGNHVMEWSAPVLR